MFQRPAFVFSFQLFVYKQILALPTWGQKSISSDLYPVEYANFDSGQPVACSLKVKRIQMGTNKTQRIEILDDENKMTENDFQNEARIDELRFLTTNTLSKMM